MTARFRKKVRRMRGSHTHGWGEKKKHRGAGSRGGKGNAGLYFQKKSLFMNDREKYEAKKGFIPPTRKLIASINLREIELLARKSGKKEIDISEFGFQKVLGAGKILSSLTIKAKAFSAGAKEKIEAAGGKAVVEEAEK
ncbi:MAG TPA: uL15m family ribosomal protein [archaeon]|nr:uL15m family ribosomal protein [archaeon]